MAVQHLEAEIELDAPPAAVFEFFARAENLERITPPELHFEIRTPGTIELHEGAIIEYRLRLLGIPFGWRSIITAWDPPRLFVDEQEKGPYAHWVHRHGFEPTAGGGTRIRDHVEYALPLQPLGDIALPFVRRQLRRIFEFRQRRVARLLDGAIGVGRSVVRG